MEYERFRNLLHSHQIPSSDSKGLAGTRKRQNPYKKGLSGIRRERPGPRFAGSIPVGATEISLSSTGFSRVSRPPEP
jgi:hypothetical protein